MNTSPGYQTTGPFPFRKVHRFLALEERAFEFKYEIPAKNKLTLTVGVTKHRITEENAEYNGILGKYPLSIEVFRKEYEMNIYQ